MKTLRGTKWFCAPLLAIGLLWIASIATHGSTVYKITFNHPPSSPAPSPYVPGPDEILPSGISTQVLDITDLVVPVVPGYQGDNVLQQILGGAWPNSQGYRFGADGVQFPGTPGPVIPNIWTIEAVVKPDFSGCVYGLTTMSNILNAENLGDGTEWGDVKLSVDQNTGVVTFAPSGSAIGVVTSTTALQAGQWYHIAGIARGNGNSQTQRTELWINGILNNTGAYPLSWETQGLFKIPGYFNIGSCYWPLGARNWQGQNDAFAISDTAVADTSYTGDFVLIHQVKTYTNVKDYGAKGDGVTDDTAAIQAAMNAAAGRSWSDQYPGGIYYASNGAVFFPSGKYLISDTIQLSVNVIGEGAAILYQTNSLKDIFYNASVWRIQISNMSFVGGQNHINVGTNNVDTAQIIIDECQFSHADDCAVRTQPNSNSTQVVIKDCVFMRCNQALVNWCDQAIISDSWITSAATMASQAVIENHGVLIAEDICGVPEIVDLNDQRWIDNYGTVTCRNFRFGGESAGFTPVVNFAPYVYTYPVIPSGVTLDDCDIYAIGNSARRCAVYCEEVPNKITVTDCRGLVDIPPVMLRPTIDLNTYFDNANLRSGLCLRFLLSRDNVEQSYDLPMQMKPYQADPVEVDAVPTVGNWRAGQFVRNRSCNGTTGSRFGWLCTATGEPGTWKNVVFAYGTP